MSDTSILTLHRTLKFIIISLIILILLKYNNMCTHTCADTTSLFVLAATMTTAITLVDVLLPCVQLNI